MRFVEVKATVTIALALSSLLPAAARGAEAGLALPSVEQVVADFEAADRACNDGKGYSEAADSGTLGWAESAWLRNYWEMYELTGQTRWWGKIIDHFDRLIAHMTDHDGDGFKSWQTKTYSTALVRAEPLHNRGSATVRVPTARILDGQQARQVTDNRYVLEFLDATHYMVRAAAPAGRLVDRADYTAGKPITIAPGVAVIVAGQPLEGDVFCVWTTAPKPVEYIVHQGMVLTPVARFVEAGLKRAPEDRYHKKAAAYLALIKKHFLQGNEKYWFDTGSGAGAYRFTAEPTERYPNRVLPHNQYLALARTWLILADAAGDPLFRRRATALAENFKRALRLVDGAYEWNYWDWIENGKPGHSGVEDTSHGHIDIGFVVEAVERHTVFTDEDGRRLARTLLVRMWNGSTTEPQFGGNVNVKGGHGLPVVDWVSLSRWDPKVFEVIAAAVMTRSNAAARARSLPTLLAAEKRIRSASSAELDGRLRAGELGFTRLVVVRRHPINPSHVYTYHTEGQKAGGGLYLVDLARRPPRRTQLVDASAGLVLDADLSFDGTTVLFSWKKTLPDKLQLYTIGVDGKNLRQLTTHDSNNLNACWLPDGGIAFLSDRKAAFAYCWTSSTPILYRCDADGNNVERLSANYLNDFTPSVLDDGRIIYSRWEYVDRPAIPIQSLWCINPDGTGLSGFFGNRVLSPATFMEAQQIPGTGRVLCVLTSHNGPCRGAIGVIDPARGSNAQEAIENLTPEVPVGRVNQGSGNNIRGPYESPFPIDDRYFLVSRNGAIVLRDYAGTQQATVVERDGPMGFYCARPVLARQRPPVPVPAARKDGAEWATVLVQDVYHGLEPYVRRGEIRQIAVVQELEKSKFADVKRRAFGFQFPVVSCGATYAPKKVWGFARVEQDGSAHFKVPPRVPIYFMAIDRQGRAVQRMRSFTHLMPGEHQSCVGCHADRNAAAPRVAGPALAALRPAEDLAEPEWGVRGFSYADIVQPVLDRHCVACHNAREAAGRVDLDGSRTDFFNVSYEILARQGQPGKNPYTKWIPTFNGQEANILEVTPRHWGSPASKLADLILSGHPGENGRPRVALGAAAQRRVFTWIDLDVPYYGTSASNHYQAPGCRQLLPDQLDRVLAQVAARRCAGCHDGEGGVPRQPYVRITNVQDNAFLLAPLARAAGGTQRCGTAVFRSTSDPDYQAILATFEPLAQLLKESPRMDMNSLAETGSQSE